MPVPQDRRYLQTHEWHKPEDKLVVIGITQFAADELTDITYVKLPEVGQTLRAGAAFGEIESVKATADLLSGVSGSVTAINAELAGNPGLVNADPYERGWMIKVQVAGPGDVEKLLSAEEYLKKIGH
ncbi:MAG: glycine cleavage system protein GcvH [Tepidisphaeraceae bacterium]|jgi:glycine cleavage system H protein